MTEKTDTMAMIEGIRAQFAKDHFPEIVDIIQKFLKEHPNAEQVPVTEPAIWLQILVGQWLQGTIPVTHYQFAFDVLSTGLAQQLKLEPRDKEVQKPN